MAKYRYHIFICTNQRQAGNPRGSCDPAGLSSLQVAFKKELAERGMNAEIRANKSGCLDQCEHGPVVVIYSDIAQPGAVWYGGVDLSDVNEIIDSHLRDGAPVERIRMDDGCINTAECAHRLRE
ncbi:MAG: (2Fe-2S) ferredoxin domain-containing protein [Acidobacteria bacterium]|nr:(2Fe-2S) ferredoxin domain-containing protein [Acidobacteriota bacterium]